MRTLIPALAALALTAQPAHAEDWAKQATEHDVVLKDFAFGDGEKLAEVKIHVATLGTPHRDAKGRIDNAVMVLHGTGGSGRTFLRPMFADELFAPGQPLDLATHYVILPDSLGHGKSSKPSDGMRMAFPKYDYADMVLAQKRMLEEGLGVQGLQAIIGTSMGCMQAFTWGTTYPGFARRLAPFACNAVEIAGRNRMWRKMSIDAIKADPAWQGGNYKAQPEMAMRMVHAISIIAGANPVALQADYPTRAKAEAALDTAMARQAAGANDANDEIYQLDSSRNYNPAPGLAKITVPVLWINSADDFINPPELGLAQQQVRQMPRARFILIPASAETKGHGTHTWAKFWKSDLAKLLAEPSPQD
ncbi:MAG: alpha/beta fold hydrolase [Proteobacteria bacterium]|nr:alpha/beta fold hydrolase [Pseudomonadota bacterium]